MKLVGIGFAKFQSLRLLLCIALCFTQVSSITNETDRLALLQFKVGITRDPFGVLNSWNNSIELCQWHGVTCCDRNWRVTVLDLSSQGLSGSISPHIGNISFLREMKLQNNSFDHEIPPQVNRLRYLCILELHNNLLVGEIPKNISGCLDLVVLSLNNNKLTGEIPGELASLLKLQQLNLYANNLIGSVPSSIGNLSSLEILHLTLNNLGGSIPQVLGHLTNLRFVDFGLNRLSGTIPCSLLNLSSLISFVVTGNQLEGPIPPSISNCTKLKEILIENNRFSGEIPEEIGNIINLIILKMELNQLSGVIPLSFANLQNLRILHLSNNKIRGIIPSSLGNLTMLLQLHLDGNYFHGQIPSHLSNCQFLNLLDLSNNNLSGTLPPQLLGLSSLCMLDLSRNRLVGVLPMEVGNLRILSVLDISDNLLVGKIPRNLGDCMELLSLRMGGNFFHGLFPQSIKLIENIQELDLSRNNLSGQIPEFLAEFIELRLLNLSYNKFEGMLPREGVFKSATGTSIVGNNDLCGGLPEFHLADCISKSFNVKSKKINTKIVVAIVILSVIEIAVIAALLHHCWVNKKVNEPVNESASISMDDSRLNISYGTLLKATGGFSSTNLIGAGSYGSVYRGILKDNEMVVAVKVLHLIGRSTHKTFIVERETLKNIYHANILKILKACSDSDHQGNDFKALVYEFMDNGNLKWWLHPCATSSPGNEVMEKLNFIQRINIAIDVASALDYLHHKHQIPIVHCDIKPSNILLDASMVAHVGDFGLAKTLDSVPYQRSSVVLRGTAGYIPPEYAMGCMASREGDVYSYGILLLEIFTGLSPTDDKFRGNLTLHNFVAKALPERVLEITDNFLLQERESHLGSCSPQRWFSGNNDIFQECLIMMYNIGLVCSHQASRNRVSMSKVTPQLCQIREKLFALGFTRTR